MKSLSYYLRDRDSFHLLHVIFLEQSAALEAVLDFGESLILHVLADGASEASEAISRIGDVDRDVFRESSVPDLANVRRHLRLEFRPEWCKWI